MPTLTNQPPKGILRALLRLPIWLYRLNLGWLLGDRFLLLSHTGRKSGRTYQTVIEVVDYDHERGIYTVASGWGEGADWYQNILVSTEVTIQVGRDQFKARAVPLAEHEAQERLFAYAQKHAGAFRELSYLMLGERLRPVQEDIHKMAQKIPLVEFRTQP